MRQILFTGEDARFCTSCDLFFPALRLGVNVDEPALRRGRMSLASGRERLRTRRRRGARCGAPRPMRPARPLRRSVSSPLQAMAAAGPSSRASAGRRKRSRPPMRPAARACILRSSIGSRPRRASKPSGRSAGSRRTIRSFSRASRKSAARSRSSARSTMAASAGPSSRFRVRPIPIISKERGP